MRKEYEVDKVNEKLGLALIAAIKSRPYMASALYALIPVKTNALPTLAVDAWWRLYYNPKYVDGLSTAQCAGGLLHEVEHVLRKHHARGAPKGLDPELFNIAGDLEINGGLAQEPAIELPPNILLPSKFGLREGLFAEEYYDRIEREIAKLPKCNCGSGAHGQPDERELPSPGTGDTRGVDDVQADIVRREVAEKVSKDPGNIPGGLRRWAEEVLQPKIPWQEVLAGTIRGAAAHVSGMVDYSYSRPSRRQAAYGKIIVPTLRRPTPEIAVVVDTSGSMDDNDLAQALAEIDGIIRSNGATQSVTVISADAAVNAVSRVYSRRQIELFGGGGTDMSTGIEEAARRNPRPDIVVVLTDGYTPWPDKPPRGMKVIVVLIGKEIGSPRVVPTWAKVIKVAA